MNISWSVDWLSMTLRRDGHASFWPAFEFGFPQDQWQGATPRHGYSKAAIHPYGHMVMVNPARDDMGMHMAISGRALKEIAKHKISGLGLLKWAADADAGVSRVDLAIDVMDVPVNIENYLKCTLAKSKGGKPKKRAIVQDSERGTTVYIGARTSDKFMRIYDKSAEQGLPESQHWTRFELELKGKVAKAVAKKLVEVDKKGALRLVQALMRGHFECLDAQYLEIMGAEAEYVTGEKNTDHDRLTWLMETCAKSMAKTIAELPHIDVMGNFAEQVEKFLQDMRQQKKLGAGSGQSMR